MAEPRLRALLNSRLFLGCVLLLVAGGLGLRPAAARLAQRYAKQPIALRKSLAEFDISGLRSFQPASPRNALPGPNQDMGTAEHTWVAFERRPPVVSEAVGLLVTYYSDPRDKVPHTPEVCYRQGGTIVNGVSDSVVEIPGWPPAAGGVPVRAVDLQQPAKRGISVYVFCANGQFCRDRLWVRWI
ncbi:MAG: hypothetical protein AB1716_16325, partial [Planctomycetota bacterium]